MKTKIYRSPIDKPPFNFSNMEAWRKAERDYHAAVIAYAKQNGKGAEAGKEIKFPIADGYAHYVVLSLKPCALIHLELGDAYQMPYIERLTASDIRQAIVQQEAFERLLSPMLPE